MFSIIILASALAITAHASIGGYISPTDREKLLAVLTKSLIIDTKEPTSAYYAAKGFQLLEKPIPANFIKPNCEHLKNLNLAGLSPDEQYQALSAWSLLPCPGKLHNDAIISGLRQILEKDASTVPEIRYALETFHLLALNTPNAPKVAQLIQAKLKSDDSLPTLGHALHAAALLGPQAGKFALDRVEEVLAQADEVDGRLFQWEGGLTATSLLLTGLLRLPAPKPFTPDQAEKLAAYLLTRRTVQTPRGALALAEAATHLTRTDVTPVAITVPSAVVAADKPELIVHISDVLGRKLKVAPSPVVAQSATRVTDDVVVLSKQVLSATGAGIEYVLPLRLEPGQYRVVLSAGGHSSTVVVRVLGPVSVDWLEIGLSDSDGGAAPKLTKLKLKEQLKTALLADRGQHLVVKFALSRPVQQSFVRLSGQREIVFVAEPDASTKQYKIDVNLATELGKSGKFDVELLIGDSVVSNPIRWGLGKLELSLGSAEVGQERKVGRGAKKEIRHMFREPEKRPAEFVSLLFTGLTLAPLLLLLGMWGRIGLNLGNFTVLALPFHLGFGGILGLFSLFWFQLDMFTTCAWLIPVGGFTFLAGHKLLSRIAKQRKI